MVSLKDKDLALAIEWVEKQPELSKKDNKLLFGMHKLQVIKKYNILFFLKKNNNSLPAFLLKMAEIRRYNMQDCIFQNFQNTIKEKFKN